MFRVRQPMLSAFRARATAAFDARIAARLGRSFERFSTTDPESRLAFVARGRERAALYGLSTNRDIALFIGVAAELGEGFDTSAEHGWASNLLLATHLALNIRLALLVDQLKALRSGATRVDDV